MTAVTSALHLNISSFARMPPGSSSQVPSVPQQSGNMPGPEKSKDSLSHADPTQQTSEGKAVTYSPGPRRAADGHELTREEIQKVLDLQKRDREVHAHEQAHIAAGGQYVRSGASYKYETGPDGKKYAVAGEVSIDTSEEKDPKATIRKMETVRRAALAPAHPSSKDRAVAAEAQIKEQRAAAELVKAQNQENGRETNRQEDSAGLSISGIPLNVYG